MAAVVALPTGARMIHAQHESVTDRGAQGQPADMIDCREVPTPRTSWILLAMSLVVSESIVGCGDESQTAPEGSGGVAAGGASTPTGGMPAGGTSTGGQGAAGLGGVATGGLAATGAVAGGGGLSAGGGALGSAGAPESGGTSTIGGTAGTGGIAATGGLAVTGGAAGAPETGGAQVVDCAGISDAGYQLCTSGETWCEAVFEDGVGCSTVCAAAGLGCASAAENVEGACAVDDALPPVACDSGHQSDYCRCEGTPTGTGGTSGTGGAPTGGAPSTGGAPATGDCNDVTAGPIVTVAQDGSGQFTTVQAALNSISVSNSTPTQIRIAPGSYYEKLTVDRPHITLCGQVNQTAATVLTYNDNADDVGTFGSYSVRITADDVSAEHLSFENSNGPGVQAVALLAQAERTQFRDCRFLGYQDTLYVHSGSQYFRNCYVEGTVDYIFGGATAVFEGCAIHNLQNGTAVTAPSTEQTVPFGIVFLGGEVTAEPGVSRVALGRNWRPYGATAYLHTQLGGHISAVGWVPMSDNTLETARFSEYQTTGPGANPGARAPQSSQLSDAQAAAYTVANIFGAWTPAFSQ